MTNQSSNVSSDMELCNMYIGYQSVITMIFVIDLVIGQPVVVRLLWIAFTSKKGIDVLNCNLALFYNLHYLTSFAEFVISVVLSATQRYTIQLLFVSAIVGGPLGLCFISLERYVAVIHPTCYPLLKKHRCREVCAVAMWVLSLFFAMVTIFMNDQRFRFINDILRNVQFSLLLLVTLTMWHCSVSIGRALNQKGPGKDSLNPMKKRALRIVGATSIITVSSYIPVGIVLQFDFLQDETYNCGIIPVCILLLSAVSIVHPVIYLSTQEKSLMCLKCENGT